MVSVAEVHHRDAALVPGLYFYVAAWNRNERAVVRHAVFAVPLGRRHFVVAGKGQLVILQVEEGISAPFVWIVCPAARAETAAPLIGEHDFLPIIRK